MAGELLDRLRRRPGHGEARSRFRSRFGAPFEGPGTTPRRPEDNLVTIGTHELAMFVGLVCTTAGEPDVAADLVEPVVMGLGASPWMPEAVGRLSLEQVWISMGRPDREAWGVERRLADCMEAVQKLLQVPCEERSRLQTVYFKERRQAG